MEKTLNAILSACSLDGKPEHAPAQFKHRLEKAAELVRAKKVYRGFVCSQKSNKAYRTWQIGFAKQWRCECADFQFRGGFDTAQICGGYGRQCKHTLAQMIAEFEGISLRPFTPAFQRADLTDMCDFWQSLSEEDAEMLHNPEYIATLTNGDAIDFDESVIETKEDWNLYLDMSF